nr:putative oxidoreductase GLYR1 isoform X2 [Physcomitrium patens]|eukprot:XP_024402020.1 putative oxidoreductase GLYR1 isoform X2 [Physcomitrella patens]
MVATRSEETHSEESHSVGLVGAAASNARTPVDPQIPVVDEGADRGADEGTSMAVGEGPPRFVHGQLVWAKFARFPWWPAEIINEKAVIPGTGGNKRINADVLVRFFGTYDYGWVDPKVGLSEFDVKLQERSKIKKKALQKGIEEALEFRRSGKLPKSFAVDVVIEEEPKTPTMPHSNGVQANGTGQQTPEDEGTEQRRAARKRKPKVLYEEERVPRKPERRLRRLRIMRQLGLAAPAGSPFILDTRMTV